MTVKMKDNRMEDSFKSNEMRELYKSVIKEEGYIVYHIFYDGFYGSRDCRMPGLGYVGYTSLPTIEAIMERYRIAKKEIAAGLGKPRMVDKMINQWGKKIGFKVLCKGLTEASALQVEGLLRPPCLTYTYDRFIWNTNPGGKIYGKES